MTDGAQDPSVTACAVDVVIVAHNAGDLLVPAARSAVEQAGATHVWIMDAESTDSSIETVRAAVAGPHIVPVPNQGFSASNNRGIERARNPFVLLLNPDAELGPGALVALLATAAANPNAAIVGPAVLNTDGSAQANAFGRFPTLASTLALRFERLAQTLSGNVKHSPVLPSATTPVDWVTGAAMLVRRAAIEDAGAMDESYFLYYEDIEWCHRMRDHGWEILLEPAARVVHHLGGAAVPKGRVAQAYRESFYRYCDAHGLWALKLFGRAGIALRRVVGGAG